MTREPPPGLVVQYPKCPMCWAETRLDGDVFTCESCGASWSLSNPEAPGEWDDPDVEQCPAVNLPGVFEVDCALEAGHLGPHRARDGHVWPEHPPPTPTRALRTVLRWPDLDE